MHHLSQEYMQPSSGILKSLFDNRHYADCDGCKVNIVGVRWKCVNCLSYDLCDNCEKRFLLDDPQRINHPREHLFVKIVTPLPSYGYFTPLPILYVPEKENPDQWEQTGKPLTCPVCRGGGAMQFASIGKCQKCNCAIPSISNKFCTACSNELEVCHECCQRISDGDGYVKRIEGVIGNEMKHLPPPSDDRFQSAMRVYIQSRIDDLGKIKDEIRGKSRLEMLQWCAK